MKPLVKCLFVSLLIITASGVALAKSKTTELLFIQHAKHAKLTFNSQQKTYSLTLEQPSSVYWFTEAPEHAFGRLQSSQFNKKLHNKDSRFFKRHPNISFVYKTNGKNQSVSYISLDNIQSLRHNQITYTGKALKGNTTLAQLGNRNLKDVAVFVDGQSAHCDFAIGNACLW